MRKLLALPFVAAALLFVLAVPAFADTSVKEPTNVFPVTLGALLAFGISSVVIPYVTAFAAAPDAPPIVTSALTAAQAGLVALVAYLVDVPGVPDWRYALGLFVSVVIGATGYRLGIEPTGATERGTPRSLYHRGLQLGKRAA